MSQITLKSLVTDYWRHKMADDLDGDWGSIVFYRPLAALMTWPLARVGASPVAVTVSGLVLLPIIAAVSMAAAPTTAVVVVCSLAVLYCVLDCVDGMLARALHRESKFGHYIDLSNDLLYRPVIYAALGHLADRLADSPQPTSLIVALVAAWLALFVRVLRLYNHQMMPRTAPSSPSRPSGFDAGSVLTTLHLALSGVDTLLPLLALVLWWFGLLPLLPIWLLIYSAADAIYTQTKTLWALRGS